MKKDTSIKKDIGIAGLSIVAFYLVLLLASIVDSKFGFTQAFNLVDVAAVSMKVATASALAWLVKRIAFAKTLGRDFGSKFDSGWESMKDVEKTRWIIGAFLALFAVISLLL